MQPEATLTEFTSYDAKYEATIDFMEQIILRYRHHPFIRRFALSLVKNTPERNVFDEAKSLFLFVRDSINFRNDVRDVETLQTPLETLNLKAGDCDDKTILLNTLLESIGRKTRIVTVSNLPGGKPLSHVYGQVLIQNEWVSMDPTRKVSFGYEPAEVTARYFYEY